MFRWLFANKQKEISASPASEARESAMKELAMRASIAVKLKNYNADEDTTISEFSLADEEKGKKSANKVSPVSKHDVWSQANPSETGKWNREVRQNRKRTNVARYSIKPEQKKI